MYTIIGYSIVFKIYFEFSISFLFLLELIANFKVIFYIYQRCTFSWNVLCGSGWKGTIWWNCWIPEDKIFTYYLECIRRFYITKKDAFELSLLSLVTNKSTSLRDLSNQKNIFLRLPWWVFFLENSMENINADVRV